MPTKPAASGLSELKYELRYCEQLVAFMSRGYSLTAFAGEIGTSRATLMRWCKDHPPFARAVERGQACRARLLEERLLGAGGSKAADMQALKAAAPDDWSASPVRASARKATRLNLAKAEGVTIEVPDNGRD